MTAPLCLLTRPEAQSHDFAAALTGVEVLISPIIRIEALPFDRNRVAAAPGLVFTSANAVGFAGAGDGKPALCVGVQTAEAARVAGYDVITGPGTADGLIPLLKGRGDWLHLRGRHRSQPLPVESLAIYDQIEQPLSPAALAAAQDNRPLILPLFSPRSAALLSRALFRAKAPITTIAISSAADTAFVGPVIGRIVADKPDRQSMLHAILSLRVTERTGLPWVETERGAR
ncbi:uroporphyrinogen-III synthase [Paracoccus albus]|uniref:uroporphyrinogen-III synthase n=1 Tax=Paracoccus albus TaxID=3017784 RepID=UPI0022F05A9E|nr:uroporphyrinogen-III synthase [Paracoccus albus]WBU60388.1 uroporphyrinogen-III synthase [Paracoccus albus]